MTVATVVLDGPGTLGAELRVGAELTRSDSEEFEDVKGIEEEGEGEEGTEELATGELVEESEGPAPVVVVLTLLKALCWAKYIRGRVRSYSRCIRRRSRV